MKAFRIITLILFISLAPKYVHAGLIINEIMYDLAGTDTDHEWIEVYNDSSSAVSLEGYKFNDGANHGLNVPPVNGGVGSMTIPANGFVVLSGNASVFRSDYPSFSGTVVDTVMALANEGDSISLVDTNNEVIDSVTYTKSQGGAGDGNSLGSFGSELAPGSPTPGKENTRTTTNTSSDDEVENEDDEEVESKTIVNDGTIPVYSGTILVKDPITAGVPTEFATLIVNPERKVVLPGKYIWNFGDGAVFEYYDGLPFTHIYKDQGEYLVYFEYYKSRGGFVPDVSIKKIISVNDGGVIISSVGTGGDSKVELSNTSSVDVNMSGWKVSSGSSTYTFPKNSIVLRGKSITLRPAVLGFSPVYLVSLIHPSGVVASQKSSQSQNFQLASESKISQQVNKEINNTSEVLGVSVSGGPIDPVEKTSEVQTSSLTANTVDIKSKPSNAFVYFGLFILVICVALIGILKIRKYSRTKENKEEDEYDPDEFTLVE